MCVRNMLLSTTLMSPTKWIKQHPAGALSAPVQHPDSLQSTAE